MQKCLNINFDIFYPWCRWFTETWIWLKLLNICTTAMLVISTFKYSCLNILLFWYQIKALRKTSYQRFEIKKTLEEKEVDSLAKIQKLVTIRFEFSRFFHMLEFVNGIHKTKKCLKICFNQLEDYLIIFVIRFFLNQNKLLAN